MNENTKEMLAQLDKMYPDAHCELNFNSPFELLVAVILSAQCTDKRVNEVTKTLFSVINTPQQFADIEQSELEKLIFSCGFYHNKARNIINCAKSIVSDFGGEVPQTTEQLCSLAGVGRKTANVVYSVAFGGNAIAVDTHVFRVANRIGLVDAKTPEKVEEGLMKIFPPELWGKAHHLLIFHGRYTCHSQKPSCDACALAAVCKFHSNNN